MRTFSITERPRLGLRRDLRLRRRTDFDAVYRKGRIFNDPLLVLRTLPNDVGHDRFGFVVSGKVGGAVVRNRVRRRLQEIVRAGQDRGPDPQGYDIVISAKVPAAEATFQELESAVRRLYVKAGLAGDVGSGS
jgi:ribonuclease P protein component